MLRNLPRGRYDGLTVIMSNPSRFDTKYLLAANGGVLFNDALYPETNQTLCDIRLMEDDSPILDGTKCILLLGQSAMHKYCPDTKDNTINEMRGSLLNVGGIPAIATYFPQDAVDFRNYEETLNESSKDYTGHDEVSQGEDEDDEGDVKRFSPTKRANFSFWIKRDIWKAKYLLRSGIPVQTNVPKYHIYPPSEEVINVLLEHKDEYLYFDMETDYEEQNMLCFSFSFDGINTYCVPILNTDYRPAYSSYHRIIRALAIAISRNILVAHNGAGFDFLVLTYKYHIPIYRVYDTMLAMHRCFPSVEKSLGHCVSYWTWERFHKDTDSKAYFTNDHLRQKLKYCGMDVRTMYLVHKAIEDYSRTIPGLEQSISRAQRSIIPYLKESLQGISYDEKARADLVSYNDRLMMQYIRMANILVGDEGLEEIKSNLKSKSKTSFLGSDKQQCVYFHDLLSYPVLFRSEKTGDPSLGKKIMYRLAMKYPDNPLIPLILHYRKIKKETGAMKFIPWKDDKGQIYFPPKEQEELYGL